MNIAEASGEDILVNVGHCRRRCRGRRRHMKKAELERLMLDNPTADPRMVCFTLILSDVYPHTVLIMHSAELNHATFAMQNTVQSLSLANSEGLFSAMFSLWR